MSGRGGGRWAVRIRGAVLCPALRCILGPSRCPAGSRHPTPRKPGFMGKRTAGPREPIAPTEQPTGHELNAATQYPQSESLQSDQLRRVGTRFKFRHKPGGPNLRHHDHLPSSHVFHLVPTCAFLLAGLLAICVGIVPVEASPSGAWIARPSRKMLSAKTTPHSADALGNAQCIVTSVESNFKDRTTQTALDPLVGSRFVPGHRN